MKKYTGFMFVFISGFILLFALSQQINVSAQCYKPVGGGDAVIVPCPNNDPGSGDSDGDGIINRDDNCPGVANPNQENTFGGGAGDACDGATVNNSPGSGGSTAFLQFDGSYDLYGDCYYDANSDDIQCRKLADLNVCSLPYYVGTSAYVPNISSPQSSQLILATLMSEANAQRTYQINIQDANGVNIQTPFNITFNNVSCVPPTPTPTPIPVDSDGDGFIDNQDYCPNEDGRAGGCPNLATYYAILSSLGIDYANIFNAPPNNNSGNNNECSPRDTNVIYVDANDCEAGDVSGPQINDGSGIIVDEAWCEAIYYQHEVCEAWADNLDTFGDYTSWYDSILGMCMDFGLSACNISAELYCQFSDASHCVNNAPAEIYCPANPTDSDCAYYNQCTGLGIQGYLCGYFHNYIVNGGSIPSHHTIPYPYISDYCNTEFTFNGQTISPC